MPSLSTSYLTCHSEALLSLTVKKVGLMQKNSRHFVSIRDQRREAEKKSHNLNGSCWALLWRRPEANTYTEKCVSELGQQGRESQAEVFNNNCALHNCMSEQGIPTLFICKGSVFWYPHLILNWPHSDRKSRTNFSDQCSVFMILHLKLWCCAFKFYTCTCPTLISIAKKTYCMWCSFIQVFVDSSVSLHNM